MAACRAIDESPFHRPQPLHDIHGTYVAQASYAGAAGIACTLHSAGVARQQSTDADIRSSPIGQQTDRGHLSVRAPLWEVAMRLNVGDCVERLDDPLGLMCQILEVRATGYTWRYLRRNMPPSLNLAAATTEIRYRSESTDDRFFDRGWTKVDW